MTTTFERRYERRDTAANWASANPVLASGELGFDTTNKILKIGDGSTAWNSLAPLNGLGLGPQSCDPALLGNSSSTTNANRALYFRVEHGGTISKIGAHVANQSGNLCFGVYANSGVGPAARPAARTATTGSVACPGGGYAEFALGASVDVKPGDWLAYAPDNATCRLLCANIGGGVVASTLMAGRSAFQDTAFPLPATATPSNGVIQLVGLIGVA